MKIFWKKVMHVGWIGMRDHVLHALRVVGADADEEGRYLIKGHVISGLGGEEMVIGNDAQYSIGGQWCGLAGLMNSTSYGLKVYVIGHDEPIIRNKEKGEGYE